MNIDRQKLLSGLKLEFGDYLSLSENEKDWVIKY